MMYSRVVDAVGRGDVSFESIYNPPRKRKREVDDEVRCVRAACVNPLVV